jgi:hypothetical protein
MKHVIVSAEFVNLTPAHKRYITHQGSGTTVSVAIGRAVDAIFKDDRIKGHRCSFPIKLVVQTVEKNAESNSSFS